MLLNQYLMYGDAIKDLHNKIKRNNLWMIYIIEQFKI